MKFECYGDGSTGTSITITQPNKNYPLSICGIKLYGNPDPEKLLNTEYLNYLYDKEFEESANLAIVAKGKIYTS